MSLDELMPYLATVIGFFLVYILNDIKGAIKELKDTVKSLEGDLRGGHASLDRRVAVIESKCHGDCNGS